MATYGAFQAHAVDSNLRIVPAAMIEVIDEATGNPPAAIFSTRAGAALANPFPAEQDGYFRFYAPAGRYRINVYKNGQVSTPWRDVPIGTAAEHDYDEFALAVSVREKLTGNRTYYIRADGSDSNSGLVNDASGAFLTVQKAIDVVCGTLDFGGFTVSIELANGTYAGCSISTPWVGGGVLQITGNSAGNRDNCILNTSVRPTCALSGRLHLVNLKSTSPGQAIWHEGVGIVSWVNVNFAGVGGTAQIFGNGPAAVLRPLGAWVISNATLTNAHVYLTSGAYFDVTTIGASVVTLSGTPAFNEFFSCGVNSAAVFRNLTFSGAATGRRYGVSLNGSIDTGGGGANFFPANSAGIASNGGQYV